MYNNQVNKYTQREKYKNAYLKTYDIISKSGFIISFINTNITFRNFECQSNRNTCNIKVFLYKNNFT